MASRGAALLCVALFSLLQLASGYDGAGGIDDYYYEEEGNTGNAGGGTGQQVPGKVVDAQQQRVTTLTTWLLDGYNRYRMPEVEGGLKVEVEIALVQFVSVSTSNEFIEIEAWWRFWWEDPRLAWNETLFDVDFLTFSVNEIWIPDVLAYEQIEDKVTTTDAQVYPSGRVMKSTPKKTKIGCPMNLVAFPFDFQECTFTVGSWSRNGLQLDVAPRIKDVSSLIVDGSDFPARSSLDMSAYVEFNSWRIAATKVVWKNNYYGCCPEPYPTITYQLRIVRSSRTHFYGIIGPMILVTLIGFAVLLMPAPLSGSRPAISITMMLTSVTVYFVASRSTPQSMQSTVVGRLYAAGIVMCSLNVFNSILATALNMISPDEKLSNKALMDFFQAFDRDNSGVLERDELDAVFKILNVTEEEKNEILTAVETKYSDSLQITVDQWKSLAELTMDSSDRGAYHNFVVKGLVSLGLRVHFRKHADKRSIHDVVREYHEESRANSTGTIPPSSNLVYTRVGSHGQESNGSAGVLEGHDEVALSVGGAQQLNCGCR